MRKLFALLWLALVISPASAQDISPALSLTSGTTPTNCTALSLFYADSSSKFACMSGTSWDNTNRSLTITGATVTTSNPVLNLSQTWNNVATTFTGLDFNLTDSASGASSLFMNIRKGATSFFRVTKDGQVFSSIGYVVTNLTGGAFCLRNCGTILSSNANAQWQLGNVDLAAPVAQTLSVQSVIAGTSNTAGTLWTIKGSAGTGTGVGGNIKLQVALAGGSGTAQNAFTDALTIEASAAVPRITAGGPVKLAGYAIASLPTGSVGDKAYVTDQDTACPVLGGTFTAGGSVVCSAFFDGTNWTHQ